MRSFLRYRGDRKKRVRQFRFFLKQIIYNRGKNYSVKSIVTDIFVSQRLANFHAIAVECLASQKLIDVPTNTLYIALDAWDIGMWERV